MTLPAQQSALADHRHRITGDWLEDDAVTTDKLADTVYGGTPTTIDPDDTASAGAAATVSRSDHQHAVTADTAATLTGTNAEGTATSFARSDHNHAFTGTQAETITTSQATTSTSFTDLSTTGPDVTMTPPPSGKVLVHIYANLDSDTAGTAAVMSFELSSGNTQAAADAFSISNVGTDSQRLGATFLLTGLAASSTLFRAKYRRTPAGQGLFADRKLIVQPVLT